MNKKIIIPLILLVCILAGGVIYLYTSLAEQQKQAQNMQELAELDKKEMENEYQQFANQYGEMRAQISNDSIVAQLTAEQEKTQRLLDELKQVKSDDIKEITRLKKELATVRAVLRSYVMEIDSLNRLNQNLTAENVRVKGQYEEATKQIEGLNTEKASLSQKVAIAAQLDAIGISAIGLNKHGKPTNKLNRNIQCSMKKTIEYNGLETPISMYWNVNQTLTAGTYQVSIFADGNMIGSRSFTLND